MVQGTAKALALSSIMNPEYPYGNISVAIRVFDHKGNLQKPMLLRSVVYAIFKKEVIQFFNDDISDFYCNYNEVAAKVFNEVLCNDYKEILLFCTTDNG